MDPLVAWYVATKLVMVASFLFDFYYTEFVALTSPRYNNYDMAHAMACEALCILVTVHIIAHVAMYESSRISIHFHGAALLLVQTAVLWRHLLRESWIDMHMALGPLALIVESAIFIIALFTHQARVDEQEDNAMMAQIAATHS